MIRLATTHDVDRIDEIALLVIQNMKESNIPQWDDRYPRKVHFEKDVKNQSLFVYEHNGLVVGAMVILPENDPPYKTITGWHAAYGDSLVIHRAVIDPKYHRQGIAHTFIDYTIQMAKLQGYSSIKIDTHHDNYKMRSFLDKHNFIYIGYLAVIDREAYEYVLEDTDENITSGLENR